MTRRWIAGIAIVPACALAAVQVAVGATGGWPAYQHDAARTGLDPDQPAITSIGTGWTAVLDGALYAQPLVLGDRE